MSKIPFNVPLVLGSEIDNIKLALNSKQLSGEHQFSKKCAEWFKKELLCKMAIPTPSCTSALELALLLAEVGPGDEVILPSYTFTSTATSVVTLGGTPVFVDSSPDSLNICPDKIEKAITNKTKVIIPVHYASNSCDMELIIDIASKHKLIVIEDAAQCIGAKYKNKPVGCMGDMSAFSFHETKNVNCGNGGMLCINNSRFIKSAEVARDKGANRQQFFRGEVDKYSWQGKGSSFFMSDLQAAFLYTQLLKLSQITGNRINTWNFYYNELKSLENSKYLIRQKRQTNCEHNAHMFYIFLKNEEERNNLQIFLKSKNIIAAPHYVPLHSSPGGQLYSNTTTELPHCDSISSRLLRLPLFYGITNSEAQRVINTIKLYYEFST